VNLDQTMTPRARPVCGGFFAKSNNNQVERAGLAFFVVTFIEPYGQPVRQQPGRDAVRSVHSRTNRRTRRTHCNPRQRQINTDRNALQRVRESELPPHRLAVARGPLQLRLRGVQLLEREAKGFLSASGIALDGNLTKTDSGGREFNTGVTVTGVRNFRSAR